jgi:putative restriction endonuclease
MRHDRPRSKLSGKPGQGQTRHQMLVAFDLYCRIPFGKFHSKNPELISAAQLIGRTPSALAMRLSNIASLDPAITSSGRRGLANASAADREMWEEMHADWEHFAIEAEQAASAAGVGLPYEEVVGDTEDPTVDYTGGSKAAQVMIRIGQNFFRRAVLSAYDHRCCITGLALPSLLVASHIIPWSADARNRLNPRNGLCLSVLHDGAFDAGIITIARNMTVHVSTKHAETHGPFFESAIASYDGHPIMLPEKFQPDPQFLDYHRQHIFQAKG